MERQPIIKEDKGMEGRRRTTVMDKDRGKDKDRQHRRPMVRLDTALKGKDMERAKRAMGDRRTMEDNLKEQK